MNPLFPLIWLSRRDERNGSAKPRLHDYRVSALGPTHRWLHFLALRNPDNPPYLHLDFHICGIGQGLQEGDFILFNPKGRLEAWNAFEIRSLVYQSTKPHLWHVVAHFVPKTELNPYCFGNLQKFPDIKKELLKLKVGVG